MVARLPPLKPGALPAGFTTVKAILDLAHPANSLVNVAGLVEDVRAPIITRGDDWKMSVTIFDKSTEDYGESLVVNIFLPQDQMPCPGPGDCFMLFSVKVQERGGVSLLTNKNTAMHNYTAAQIPEPPGTAAPALNPACNARAKAKLPNEQENAHIARLYHATNKSRIPEPAQFQVQLDRSLNVTENFSLLERVCESRFYDLVVRVIREPWDQQEKISFWVTDYTENPSFYHHQWAGKDSGEGRDGDPYGYVASKLRASTTPQWPGPFGKRSLQVTCWQLNAFRSAGVKCGDWVRLRNVRIKYGSNHHNLEGALHEDRNGSSKLCIEVLDSQDPEMDARLKDAIRRKREYEKSFKRQKKSYVAEAGGQLAGEKRKHEDAGEQRQSKAKEKRKAKRANKQAEYEQKEQQREAQAKAASARGLNDNVKCENQDEPALAISTLVERVPWTFKVEDREIKLDFPFVCGKYRINARVVDFWPKKLEEFASWRKNSEYDVLSDAGNESDSDSSSDDDDDDGNGQGTLHGYRGPKTWEWRFALLLEEPEPPRNRPATRQWVVVNNIEAQQLLSLDACDLRADPSTLASLRERLFTLWGNLEELKAQELARQREVQSRRGSEPPPSSPSPTGGGSEKPEGGSGSDSVVSNKPFPCCVCQYGVRTRESDPAKANAGEGHRWERVFGLFGTKILYTVDSSGSVA